MHYYHR